MTVRRTTVRAITLLVIGGGVLTHGSNAVAGVPARGPRGTPARLSGPTKPDRLLVLAPHCDDEVVACGGLIQQAVAAGAPVQVVIVTNGDAFRVGAERLYRRKDLLPEDYVAMGVWRQRESLTALRLLGVGGKQVAFLGYPDGGTARMWLGNWEPARPYSSRRTAADRSPYPNSFRQNAPYCGRSLLDDLTQVIAQFRPTLIALPHPSDRHSDHWAGYCYGMAALYELGMLGKTRILLYLVHQSESSVAESGPGTVPPAGQLAEWQALSLTPRQQQQKRAAIRRYQTQLPLLRGFMMGFVAPIEWYAEARVSGLPSPPEDHIVVDGSVADWGALPPMLSDPADCASYPAGDLLTVRVCRASTRLYLLFELAAPPSPEVGLELHLHPFRNGVVAAPITHLVSAGRSGAGVVAVAKGQALEVKAPWAAQDVGALLCVDTHREGKTLDRTRWVAILSPPYRLTLPRQ